MFRFLGGEGPVRELECANEYFDISVHDSFCQTDKVHCDNGADAIIEIEHQLYNICVIDVWPCALVVEAASAVFQEALAQCAVLHSLLDHALDEQATQHAPFVQAAFAEHSGTDYDDSACHMCRDRCRSSIAQMACAWGKFKGFIEKDHGCLLEEVARGGEDWWCEDFVFAESEGRTVDILRAVSHDGVFVSQASIFDGFAEFCHCSCQEFVTELSHLLPRHDKTVDIMCFALRHAMKDAGMLP